MPFSYPTTQDLMQPVVPPKESIENNLELETREINDSDEEVEGLLTNRRESVSDEVEKMTRRVSNGELRRSSSKSFNNSGNIGVGRKSSLSSSGRVSGLMNRLLGEMPKRERSIFFREMLTQVSYYLNALLYLAELGE